MDNETQRKLFADAVAALGGQQATSRALKMSDRSVRMLLSGDRRLHAGILEDMANALIAHADLCRTLERKLSPAFAGNRTDAQTRPPLHSGKPQPLLAKLGDELHKARAAGKTPEQWLFGYSFYDRLFAETGQDLHDRTIFGLPWEATKDENLHERGYVLEVEGE